MNKESAYVYMYLHIVQKLNWYNEMCPLENVQHLLYLEEESYVIKVKQKQVYSILNF